MPTDAAAGRNRLLLPLAAVSALCVAEAVVIAFLLGRGDPTPRAVDAGGGSATSNASPSTAAATAVAPTSQDASAAGPAITRGKKGERVESGGLAITVVTITNEPRFKEINTPPPTQKFVGVEVLLENRGAAAHRYFSTSFNVKDDRDRVYGSRALGAGDPEMGFGTVVPGERVRGHLAFVVPKEASGLKLTYGGADMPRDYRPIHIDLGQ